LLPATAFIYTDGFEAVLNWKLRVIHLFEADFNLMIGILFGRRAMYHQVDNQLLNTALYGRPGGGCPDSSISKVLHNLISSLTHTPMGHFESDAIACFVGRLCALFSPVDIPQPPRWTIANVGTSLTQYCPQG
jgi:hypothetical protein